jgi:N-methylhydantoinase B
VVLIAPIFFGGELVAFAVNKAHWTDLGGMAAGSWTTDATEIYQEGLQFPAILLYRDGQPIPSLIDLIAANVRLPSMTLGDLYASVASLHVGERGVIEVCRKYGVAALRETVAIMLERGEQVALARLAELPAGEYVAEDWIDDDGLSDQPLRVCVRVTIWPDGFTADFTGSAPQVPGPINTTWTGLQVACREIFKEIVDPHFPNNEGIFRPLRIVCPEGTIFTARRPAAVSTYWETGAYVSDLIWRALFPIATDRLPVGHSLSVCGTIVSGVDEECSQFVLVEPQAGGWGATVDRDGESGLVVAGDGETFNMPVEVCEARYPILVDRYAFNTRSAGAGRYRGGFGLIRDYRVACDRVELTATFGRHRFLPWGAGSGGEGSANAVEIYPAGTTAPAVRRGKLARYPLHRGDIARLITGIGGGYGDPMTRDLALVQADVRNEFITIEQARDVHGVVINPANLIVDETATRALRARR